MTTVRVFGNIKYPESDLPWANARIFFVLERGSYTSSTQYPSKRVSTQADALGDFEIELWANGEGLRESNWRCVLPDGDNFVFVLSPNVSEVPFSSLRNSEPWIPPDGSGGNSLEWTSLTGNVLMSPMKGYICQGDSLQTLTLPVSATPGKLIYIVGEGTGLFRIAQNAGQRIRFGDRLTSLGLAGRIDSFAVGDSLTLICISPALWQVISPNGNFEVA